MLKLCKASPAFPVMTRPPHADYLDVVEWNGNMRDIINEATGRLIFALAYFDRPFKGVAGRDQASSPLF